MACLGVVTGEVILRGERLAAGAAPFDFGDFFLGIGCGLNLQRTQFAGEPRAFFRRCAAARIMIGLGVVNRLAAK